MAYTGFDLSGKVALVTGGNGGIGLGMAQAMAQAGANIVIWGTNADKNETARAALAGLGVKVLTSKVDVSQEQQVIDAFGQAVQQMGRVDTVIANAGIGFGAPSFMELKIETFRKVMAVNMEGAFFTLREAARHMISREGGGSLVGVASLAAVEGAARNQAYGASKGGLISMIKGISVELARYGVRANAILPGWIATDMTEASQASQKFNDNVIGRVPIRRWGQPEDFAGVAVYLASDASRYHTGDQFVIDGGYAIF
ncbi:MAG: SDR family oxidoreductase [Alphaproteobacteria bacterium]|nr:SDR family oxidoreductase [Alphaproteobacteria bacterium]